MQLLESLLAHLDAYERSEFLVFLSRFNAPKELQLAKLISGSEKLDSETIRKQLYGTGEVDKKQRDAYSALRRKVTERLVEWIVTLRINHESTPSGKIFGLMMVAQMLIERNGVETARALLAKAEELATMRRRYEVLDTIYFWMIDHADTMGLPAKECIAKWEANRKKFNEHLHLRQLVALQREQIRIAKVRGLALNPENSLKNIKKKLNIEATEANDPLYMLQVIKLVRAAIVSGKDYSLFENFVSKIYLRLTKHNCFGPSDVEFELEFLFIYAHACYRNRKFEMAEELCTRMKELSSDKGLRTHPVYPRYLALRAGIASLSGRREEAITLMEKALDTSLDHSEINEWLNMQLNLSVYYFQTENYRKANKVMFALGKSNSELQDTMGMEWCFKKQMIELIIQYELGNPELSLKMVNQLRKEYAPMLSHPMYGRADIFLTLISRLAKDPHIVNRPEFKEMVKNSHLSWPNYKEDVQAITFFCWLRSKMENRPYYEVLLDRLSEV
jgi:tetratricopeptide (TPR) repeat protein